MAQNSVKIVLFNGWLLKGGEVRWTWTQDLMLWSGLDTWATPIEEANLWKRCSTENAMVWRLLCCRRSYGVKDAVIWKMPDLEATVVSKKRWYSRCCDMKLLWYEKCWGMEFPVVQKLLLQGRCCAMEGESPATSEGSKSICCLLSPVGYSPQGCVALPGLAPCNK